MKKIVLLMACFVLAGIVTKVSATQLSGLYTIDSSGTASATVFKDFTSAITYLTSTNSRPDGGPANSGTVGVSGPVVFEVLTGTYIEQVNIPVVTGASSTNTITFDGGASNASTRILQFSTAATSDNHTFRFNACSFVHLRNLTIKALGASAGVAIQFLGAVSNNSVKNCIVTAVSTSTTSVKAINISATNVSATGGGCTSSAAAAFNIFIDSNYISGGNMAIFFSSSATTQSGGNFNVYIRWNQIFNAYTTGISASSSQGYCIESNYIKMSTASTTSKGIHHCNGSTTGINYYKVVKNIIEDAGQYGIHFQSNNSNTGAAYPCLVAQNFIRPTFRNATSYGFDFSQPRNHKVIGNTILMNQANGVGINLGSSANAACIIKNNIIQLLSPSSTNLCIISGAANLDSCDYNVFTKGGTQPNLLSVAGTTYTRSNFKSGTQNRNSTMDDPMLNSLTDPKPKNICQKGTPHTWLDTIDLYGVVRMSPPQIGCSEPIGGLALDANPVKIIEPIAYPVVSGSQDVKVIIKNSGTATLTSLDVSVNLGTTTNTVNWTGSLNSCEIDTVVFTGINQLTLAAGTNTIRAWTSNPNASLDSNATNDTIQNTYCTPLATGNYTIGATGTFASFTEVANILNCGGITGNTPLVFDVLAGIYNENLGLGVINGATDSTPIIFRSFDMNADSVIISYNSGSSGNFLVQLAETKNVKFEKMTFIALNTTAGRVFELTGAASNDTIIDCKIKGQAVASTGNALALIFANGVSGKKNVIMNNEFTNGAYGIYYYGVSTAIPADSVIIENNTFNNAYYMTIACSNHRSVKIRRNTIFASSYTSTYGIYLINSINGIEVCNNKVRGQLGAYGISLSSVNGISSDYGIVRNNDVSGGVASTYYGLYMSSCTYLRVSHNSISANSTAATNYAFWTQFTASTGTTVVIRNNVFNSNGTGTAITNAAMYVYNKDYFNANYNNIFNKVGPTLVNIATPAASHPNIHSWRAASIYDKNSVSYHPGFTSTSDLMPNPNDSNSWSLNGHGTYLPLDTIDYLGVIRPTSFVYGIPDLGAYEFTPVSAPPMATTSASQLAPDSLQIFMFAGDTVAKIKWSMSFSVPSDIQVRQFSGMRPPYIDTTQTNYMNFHTDFKVPTGFYLYDLSLYYKENWRGRMENETQIRMAKFDSSMMSAPWTAYTSTGSSVDTVQNIIFASGLNSFSFYTGTDDLNPLPVTLGRFIATKIDRDASLFWTTTTEINSDYFEIERSINGEEFISIGRVKAAGNSHKLLSYRYTDLDPMAGANQGIAYYRLKIVDRDQSFERSDIVMVDFGSDKTPIGLKVMPNPYLEDFNVLVQTDNSETGTVVVYDLQGKQMYSSTEEFIKGENNVHISSLHSLPSGLYLVEVTTPKQKQIIRFMKGN